MKTLIWRTWLILVLPFAIAGMLVRSLWSTDIFDHEANQFFPAWKRAWEYRPRWDGKDGYGGPGL